LGIPEVFQNRRLRQSELSSQVPAARPAGEIKISPSESQFQDLTAASGSGKEPPKTRRQQSGPVNPSDLVKLNLPKLRQISEQGGPFTFVGEKKAPALNPPDHRDGSGVERPVVHDHLENRVAMRIPSQAKQGHPIFQQVHLEAPNPLMTPPEPEVSSEVRICESFDESKGRNDPIVIDRAGQNPREDAREALGGKGSGAIVMADGKIKSQHWD
jgi:hypothetical protein